MLAYVLKYLKGSIFLNAYASSIAEMIGKLSTIAVLQYASLKRVFLVSLCLSLTGIFLLIVFSGSDSWIPLMLLIAKFGLSQAFVAAYLSVVLLYPTILVSTAMGVCNLFARISTITAPLVAEVKTPFNLMILFAICFIALVASQCLKVPQSDSNDIRPNQEVST